MKILALELSSPKGSIAWSEPGEEQFDTSFPNDRKDSGLFFASLRACLERFGNPDRIVVGLGPGSYAGTRIAIATATGLGAASGASLAGISSLCGMETEAAEYVAIGDARRQSFYFTRIRERRCVEGPLLCTADELQARLDQIALPVFASEPLWVYPAASISHPAARVLALLPAELGAEPLEPVYLRAPHITFPAK